MNGNALRQKLLNVFAVEYREHLAAIRALLEKSGEALAGSELTEATRRAHSLKGAARAVGLSALESLAHRLEQTFIDAGKGGAPLDRDMRRLVVDSLDEIEDQASADVGIPAADAATPAGGTSEAPGDAAEPPRPVEAASIRIDAQNLDRLLRSAGELHADLIVQRAAAVEIDRLSRTVRALETRWAKLWRDLEGGQKQHSRARAALLAANGDEIAVEMRGVAAGLRAAARRNDRGSRSLQRHLADLEHHVKAARMLPAESAFGTFRKMVRDLAVSEGKDVEVTIEGLDCQADRLVLQRIKDPVMHMLRNAVSHGIEPATERIARGKPGMGSIALRISEDGNRLTMVVEDDGRGIDFRKVAAKAVSEGRLPADEAARATADTLLPLVFEAGFSTADAVTTISGRGVGLSVVRETVAGLQGSVDVQTRPGQGTTMRLSLPVSILARRLLMVGFRDALYAIPTDAVVRVLRVPAHSLVMVAGRPAVKLADSALPLVSIGEIVDAADPFVAPGKSGANVVIVRTGSTGVANGTGHVAVAVDALLGVREFVVRALDIANPANRRWSGVVAVEDGTPCLVLNPSAFLRRDLAAAAVLKAPTVDPDRGKVILVVDDSITTRTLEKSILEAHGFRVRLSVDGREALAEARREAPDLVISDVEMPHVDGFELLRTMKSDRALAAIPVILVTSRADDGDRERGLRLGADAYVVKQKFDQTELLHTIRQML